MGTNMYVRHVTLHIIIAPNYTRMVPTWEETQSSQCPTKVLIGYPTLCTCIVRLSSEVLCEVGRPVYKTYHPGVCIG